MEKYQGWIRLGIVLSVMWLALSGGFLAYHYHAVNEDFTQSAWQSRNDGVGRVFGRTGRLVRCESTPLTKAPDALDKFVAEAKLECTQDYTMTALVMLGPIFVLWAFTAFFVWVVLWLHGGFKRQ